MKKKISLLCAVLLLAAFLTGCGGSGVAPVVTVNGTELTIGESYMYTLTQTDEGYQERIYRADAVGAVPYGELEANSYCADLLHIYKDDSEGVQSRWGGQIAVPLSHLGADLFHGGHPCPGKRH